MVGLKIYLEGKTSAELEGHLVVGFRGNRGEEGASRDLSLRN